MITYLNELPVIRERNAAVTKLNTEWVMSGMGQLERERADLAAMVSQKDVSKLLFLVDALLAENARLRQHELAPSDTVNAAHGE